MKEWVYVAGVFIFVLVCVFLIFSIISVSFPLTAATFVGVGGINIPFPIMFVVMLTTILFLVFVLIKTLH